MKIRNKRDIMVSVNQLLFNISDSESIFLNSDESLDNIDCCYRLPILYKNKHKKIMLSDESVNAEMTVLATLLRNVLNNQAYLHKSITKKH
jgi:hypothetical protein